MQSKFQQQKASVRLHTKRMEKRSFSHIQLYSDLANNARHTAHLEREGGREEGRGRREGEKDEGKEGRREGGKEGREEGRKEGRKLV